MQHGGSGGACDAAGGGGAATAALPSCTFCKGTYACAAAHAALLLIGAICVQHGMPGGSIRLSKRIGSLVGRPCKRAPVCQGCDATGCMECVGEGGFCEAPGLSFRDAHLLCKRCSTVVCCRLDCEDEWLVLCRMCSGSR